MIYEFTGKYKIDKADTVYLIDKKLKRKYKVVGEDTKILINVLPYLTGTYSIKEVRKHSNIEEKDLNKIIEYLKEINLVKVYNNNKLKLLIFNDGNPHSTLLETMIVNSERLSGCDIKVENISGFSVNEEYKERCTLILSLSFLYNTRFIKDIEEIAINNRLNFLNVTLFGNKNYIGPLFSFEDGPCSLCLEKTSLIKNVEYDESLGHSYRALAEMIINEILRFTRDYTYVNAFNTVIEVDFSDLNLNKSRIYKFPNCKQCRSKRELLI